MKNSVQRWDVYNEALEEINTWLNDAEGSKGQLEEMKTSLQRFKYISEELKKKQESMEKLKKEARELSFLLVVPWSQNALAYSNHLGHYLQASNS